MNKNVLIDCPNDMHRNQPNFVFVFFFFFLFSDENQPQYDAIFCWQLPVQYSFFLIPLIILAPRVQAMSV